MAKDPGQADTRPKNVASDLPTEKIELRPGDAELPFEQFGNVSVFAGLSKKGEGKLKGKGGRRAVVLRKYQAGEVICRQGDAGWTAFYILKAEDLLRVRESQLQEAEKADQALSERDPSIAKLDAAAKYARADSLEQSDGDAELIALLRTSADRPTQSELESLRAEQRIQASAGEADVRLGVIDPELVTLDPAEKRAKADASSDAQLVSDLRASAEGADLRGKADVSLTIHRGSESSAPSGGFVARMMRGLFQTSRKSARPKPRHIPIDGPVDLNYENPIAKLNEGELFGEMSCINYFPRSATVRAARDCYMVEMLRNVLEVLLENETFKQEMDAVYRQRVLADHLRAIPIFANAGDDVLARLRDNVDLITKKPGDVIFEEGDPSDSVYVIRIGTVKVYRKAAGGERVLAYRARGEVIGEMGVISGAPRTATCAAYEHPRGDKKTRSGGPSSRVELVRITEDLFNQICEMYPAFRSDLEDIARERKEQQAVRDESSLLHFSGLVDDLGLMQGQKLMLIDLERCTRCDECVRACVDSHDDGVSRLFREGPRFGKYLVPSACRQCLDPVCMIGCPVGSIHKGDIDEIVIEDWCIGCGICAQQCPYDSINMHDLGDKIAVVCDQCASLGSTKASCVYACPHEAALRVDAQTFFSQQLEPNA